MKHGILVEKREEAREIMGFRLRVSEPISFIPGQYIMLAFPDDPETKKSFSIVTNDPIRLEVQLLIKLNGPFTQRLFDLPVGSEVKVFGPYGRFVLRETVKPVVFIAGGIGITPLYCMLNSMVGKNNRAYVFYSGKKRDEMVLVDKLQQISDPNINIRYFFTREGTGRIDSGLLESLIPEFSSCLFYICAPELMINSLRNQLLERNIADERIRTEEF